MRLTTALTILVVTLKASHASDRPPSPEELLAFMKAGNAKLLQTEKTLNNYQCKYKISVQTFDSKTGKSNSKESTKFLRVYKKDGKICYHIEKTQVNPSTRADTDEIIGVLTDKSMFMISRRDLKAEWVLSKYSIKDYEKDYWESFSQHALIFHPLVALDQSLLIEKHLFNPTFRLSSVRSRPDGRIDAEYSVEWESDSKKDLYFSQKGTIVLDPKFNFAVIELSCMHTLLYSGSKSSSKPIHFTRILDESGSCRTLQYKYGKDIKFGVQDISLEFVDHSLEPVSDEVFNLDYYKIPPPGDVDAQPIPFYLTTTFWICTCGVCVLLAILFALLARGHRSGH